MYTFDGERPRFHRLAPPAGEELERLLDTRITRTLVRSGALVAQEYDDEEQLRLDLDPDGADALTQLQSASIRYRIAVDPIAGRKALRLHTPGAALEGDPQVLLGSCGPPALSVSAWHPAAALRRCLINPVVNWLGREVVRSRVLDAARARPAVVHEAGKPHE